MKREGKEERVSISLQHQGKINEENVGYALTTATDMKKEEMKEKK